MAMPGRRRGIDAGNRIRCRRRRGHRGQARNGDPAAGAGAAAGQHWPRRAAARAGGGRWRGGVGAGVGGLSCFVEAEPVLARGLLVEVHVAGGAALEKRGEVFERLSSAMDGARRETSGSRHSPPPIAAAFMVGAIEEAVCAELVTGTPERFTAAVPQLAQMVVNAFFGAEAAREELEALGTA